MNHNGQVRDYFNPKWVIRRIINMIQILACQLDVAYIGAQFEA